MRKNEEEKKRKGHKFSCHNDCCVIMIMMVRLCKSKTHVSKSGLSSGFSDQHCRIMLIASGGAAPFETEGRMRGGGFFSFAMISSGDSESIQ